MNATRPLDPFNESQWLHHIATVEQVGAFRMGHLLLMTAIFVAGMIGNVLTCLVIYCDRSMHNVTNYYLFNLAVSDLVVLIIMFIELIYKVRQLSDQQDEWGDLDCKVQFFMVGALWNNGVLIMTALAVERYVAVRHPLAAKRRRVRRRVARVMAAVWTAAVLETLPDVFVIRLVETRVGPVCFVALTWYTRVINAATAVVTFLLPLTVMLYMYIAIAITVNAGQNQNHGDNIFNHRNHRKKVNNLIMALTLSFLVCWLPHFGLRVLVAFGTPRVLLILPQYLVLWYEAVGVSAWFSSVLNPLLFSLMSTKFRKALKNLWYTKLLRRNLGSIYEPSTINCRVGSHS
ncbi:neuromedin-U receptor 2 isoform X1 [Amyelois transitella]|uniref:neuromedin-U receptor 2 isoform X1 n=1 Tax=Amyelois transitella TaxID=680683 RepID=UPI00067D165E|nr:neuromedin-U receptor 2 isoform X1 [Amyelois transitella]